jgi:hypothetical protein
MKPWTCILLSTALQRRIAMALQSAVVSSEPCCRFCGAAAPSFILRISSHRLSFSFGKLAPLQVPAAAGSFLTPAPLLYLSSLASNYAVHAYKPLWYFHPASWLQLVVATIRLCDQ